MNPSSDIHNSQGGLNSSSDSYYSAQSDTSVSTDDSLEGHLYALLNDVQEIGIEIFGRITQKIENIAKDVVRIKEIADKFANKVANEPTNAIDISTDNDLRDGIIFLMTRGIDVQQKNVYTKQEIAAMQQKIIGKLQNLQKETQNEEMLRDSSKKHWDKMEQFVMDLLKQLSDIITSIIRGFSKAAG